MQMSPVTSLAILRPSELPNNLRRDGCGRDGIFQLVRVNRGRGPSVIVSFVAPLTSLLQNDDLHPTALDGTLKPGTSAIPQVPEGLRRRGGGW